MMVQRKLTLLLTCVTLLAVTVLAFLNYSHRKTIEGFVGDLERPFEEKLTASAGAMTTFVKDYSYWDDLVLFLNTGNTAWASRNFDPCLAQYKTNALWIYKADATPVYAANNIGAKDLEALPLPKDAVKKLFAKSRFCHFYVQVPKGLMEVYGATIHPTKDAERKTEPRGYLLAGRLWSDRFIGDLAHLAGSSLALTASAAGCVGDEFKKKDMVVSARQLAGWDGTAVQTVCIGTVAPAVKAVERSLSRQFWTVTALLAVIIGFLYVFVAYWVSLPLGRLYRGLDSEDPVVAAKLCNDGSEFGYIAQLVRRLFEQKTQLLSETAQFRQSEETLTKDKEKLRSQVMELSEEMLSLKAALKQAVDTREQAERLTREVAELQTANKIHRSAYAEMERQLEDVHGRLEVVNELLQREIITEHEQRDAALTAIAEKERLEVELAALKAELANRDRELLVDRPIVRPTIIIDKKMKTKKKNVTGLSFEARC
jgi:phage shock protein A